VTFWLPSKLLNVWAVENMAFIGLINDIPTIMIGKIDIELPAMYMIRRFMGTWKKKMRIEHDVLRIDWPKLPVLRDPMLNPKISSWSNDFDPCP
jgi:hypothetical protein